MANTRKPVKKSVKCLLIVFCGILLIIGVILLYLKVQDAVRLDNVQTELTQEQANTVAAKYYHESLTQPSDLILSALETELADEYMVSPQDYTIFLDAEYEFHNGYGVMENGIAYAATETVMTGVTQEVYDFYYAWTDAQNDSELIYKIWYPGYHYTTYTSLTDGGMVVVEDIGCGAEKIVMSNIRGIDLPRGGSSGVIETYMVNGTITSLNGNKSLNSILFHVKYLNEDSEVVDRCIVWFGCYFDNGKLIVDLTGLDDPIARAAGMAHHSAGENAHLTTVMHEIYEDNKDSFDINSASVKGKGSRGGSK